MRPFSAKIIVFGEYSILSGSNGLAIPFPKFTGTLQYNLNSLDLKIQKSAGVLKSLGQYATYQSFNAYFLEKDFSKALANGLYFESNIPQGYGLGSSGALVAAIYDSFFSETKNLSISQIKADLAQLESFFHGSSSGTDPLVSYVNKAVLLNNTSTRTIDFDLPTDLFFVLMDTEITAQTQGLVGMYKEMLNDKIKNKQFTELNTLVNTSINSLLNGGLNLQLLNELSEKQQALLAPMFKVSTAIKRAQKFFEGQFVLKLCGSGGGGFVMGIAPLSLKAEIEPYLISQNIRFFPIH